MFSTCFTYLVHDGQWVIFVFTPNSLTFGFLYVHNLQVAHIEIGFRCFLCPHASPALPSYENNSPPIYKFGQEHVPFWYVLHVSQSSSLVLPSSWPQCKHVHHRRRPRGSSPSGQCISPAMDPAPYHNHHW